MRSFFLILLVFAILPLAAQEICTNGIDDDGNGFIDLQDEACECNGISTPVPSGNLIPNPSFSDFECCPSNFTQLYCSGNWQSLSTTTPDLHHTCGYLGEAGLEAGILPPPDGDGAAGIIVSPIWKEYIRTCLDEALVPNESYFFQMEIASSPNSELGLTCAGGEIFYGELEMVLYGSTECPVFPQIGIECPSINGDGWVALGSVVYQPEVQWGTFSFDFSTDLPIQALALGPPCELLDNYESIEDFCYPYFYFDNLVLSTLDSAEEEISIVSAGNLCDGNATLTANTSMLEEGGEWQWYQNGIALLGETSTVLDLSAGNYPAGIYTAVLFLEGECASAEAVVSDQSDFTAALDVAICSNESYVLPNGEAVNQSGSYTVETENGAECDSLITVNLALLPIALSQETALLCPGDSIVLADGSVVDLPGTYTSVFTSANGCDSLVELSVALLPEASAFFEWSSEGFLPETTLSFQNLSSNAESYFWEFPNGESTLFEPVWTLPTGLNAANLCLTVTSADGCTDRFCASLALAEEFTFYCPNAFTPDNDGLNEGFGPVVRGHDPTAFSFEVWNRWGERVYFSENADDRWIANYKDGSYYVPDGVYVWQATVKPLGNPETLRFKGHVVVLR